MFETFSQNEKYLTENFLEINIFKHLKECLNCSRVIEPLKQKLIKKEENLKTSQKMKTTLKRRLNDRVKKGFFP